MSKAPIMPFFTDAYLADCHHLTTEAHGAYLLILLHTWRAGGKALPDDDRLLRSIVKATPRRWTRLKAQLQPFFDISDGCWRQKKLEAVWANVEKKLLQNSANGQLGNASKRARKALTAHDSPVADAAISRTPTINHEPQAINHSEEDPMLDISVKPEPRSLPAFASVLRDAQYFAQHSPLSLPPVLQQSLPAALIEADAQLTPAEPARLQQILSRLMMHFPAPAAGRQQKMLADYTSVLKDYPEDLLCVAYQHVLRHHRYHNLPKIADLVAIIEPEFLHRKSVRRKLDYLSKKEVRV